MTKLTPETLVEGTFPLAELWRERKRDMKQWDMLRIATLTTLTDGVMERTTVFETVPQVVYAVFGVKKDWSHNQTVSRVLSELFHNGLIDKRGRGAAFKLTEEGECFMQGWWGRDAISVADRKRQYELARELKRVHQGQTSHKMVAHEDVGG